MSDALSTELAEARRGIQVALATVHGLSDEEQQAFLGEIAGFIALTGGGWPAEQRGEFIDQAAADLSEIPVRLLAPAIREARRRVWEPKRFVSWVHEFVSRDHGRLIEERDTIEKLARIVETTEVAPA